MLTHFNVEPHWFPYMARLLPPHPSHHFSSTPHDAIGYVSKGSATASQDVYSLAYSRSFLDVYRNIADIVEADRSSCYVEDTQSSAHMGSVLASDLIRS